MTAGKLFNIIAGKYAGNAVFLGVKSSREPAPLLVQDTSDHTLLTIEMRQIRSMSLIESKIVDTETAVGFGLVGGLLAGPIGLALGAGVGAFNRNCTFALVLDSGETLPCEGKRIFFNAIEKAHKIFQVSEGSE